MTVVVIDSKLKDDQILSKETAEIVVRYAKKRLKAVQIEEYLLSRKIITSIPTIAPREVVVGRILGKGSFSGVYEIKSVRRNERQATVSIQLKPTPESEEEDEQRLVLKILRRKGLEKPKVLAACVGDMVKEGKILASLNHPNVLSCKAWSSDNGVDEFMNGRNDAFFLVLGRVEETLRYRIRSWHFQEKYGAVNQGLFAWLSKQKKNKKISSNEPIKPRNCSADSLIRKRTQAILELAAGVDYMHSQGVLHRDIKPSNVGFDSQGVLKIFDLDGARVLPTDRPIDTLFKLTKRIGSPRYMSPEVANGERYNFKSDVYSFAIVCYEVLSLQKPFQFIPRNEHEERVYGLGERPSLKTNSTKFWPKSFKQCVKRCWAQTPSSRPTMGEAKKMLEQLLPVLCFDSERYKELWKKHYADPTDDFFAWRVADLRRFSSHNSIEA